MHSPHVTVIIPTYNHAAYLPDAVESALAQTHPDVEVIVVDDGSTDESAGVIAAYRDRVTAIFQGNGGMASTHNTGFAASSGELVIFLDADDALLPTAAARAAEVCAGGVSHIQWPVLTMDATGSVRDEPARPRPPLREGDLRAHVVRNGPLSYETASMSGNAWSRGFLERVLPIPEDTFRRHSDTYFATLAPLHGLIRALNEPQTLYRVHGANDWACDSTVTKMRRLVAAYDELATVLARALEREGVAVDPAGWRARNPYYSWLADSLATVADVERAVPRGATFVLVDGGEWIGGRDDDFAPDRHVVPFLERDGRYWGAPPDDAAAISELVRLRDEGAGFLVVAWPAFWWLDHYGGFTRYLDTTYRKLAQHSRITAFELSKRASGSAGGE